MNLLIKKMEQMVNDNMLAYKEDFYNYDLPELEAPTEKHYVWIIRKTGTYLIPESEVADSNIYEYFMGSESFYKVDMENQEIKKIDEFQFLKDCRSGKKRYVLNFFEDIYKHVKNATVKKFFYTVEEARKYAAEHVEDFDAVGWDVYPV